MGTFARLPAPLLPPRRRRAAAALAVLAAHATGAAAGGFQGTATVALGSATVSSAGSTDTVTVASPTAILDWRPSDTGGGTAPISFLPAGATAVFQGNANFTVLNRILPAAANRPVAFDGQVTSQLLDAAGTASRGGNVWFYAPGGILVGATGRFDIGSLILTSDAISVSGGVPSPAAGIRFAGAANSTAAVTLRPDAQVNAPVEGSYVALVAPRVNQGGTVTVAGSVGYLAAAAAEVTINAGLFAISNVTGATGNGNDPVLSHTGATTGPAESAAGTPHVVYMVAVPANDAVTMLVSGTVGYQAASSASARGGSILLGGGEVVRGNPETVTATANAGALGGPGTAGVTLAAATLTSPVRADATGAITAAANGSLSAPGALTLHAAGALTTGALSAGGAATLTGRDVRVGGLTAGGAAAITASGTATLTGTVDAPTIAVTSGDLAIAPGAALGSARTTELTLTDAGAGAVALGDNTGAASGGYALSATELARLHAGKITVLTRGDAGSQPLVIGNFTLHGDDGLPAGQSANLLGAGTFAVRTAGPVRVVGTARFADLTAGTTVSITTNAAITGVLPGGGVVLNDAAGAPAGTLALSGESVVFATPAAAQAVASATDLSAINDALAAPAVLNTAGYLRADTVQVTFTRAFLTQNSGPSDAIADRAGVTATNGGIAVQPVPGQPALEQLVLNARLVDGATTLTGGDVFARSSNTSGTLAAGSTLNGCDLAATICGTSAAAGGASAGSLVNRQIQPVQDVVAQVTQAATLQPAGFDSPVLVSTAALEPAPLTPLIDGPVTGTGNEAAWVGIGVGRDLDPRRKVAPAPRR